jgi:dTDP-glucose 4,6-dehydratase
MTMAWARTYGIEYLIARPTNNYGINQYPEKLIPLSVKNLQRGKKIRLHDSGQPTRIWLHAEDTVSAIMTIIDSGNVNEIYNISGDFEQRNLDTVKKIIRHFNGTYDEWDKHTDLSYVRQGQDVRYSLDDTKIRKLGWKPKKVFDNEIPSIVQYYKKNFIW